MTRFGFAFLLQLSISTCSLQASGIVYISGNAPSYAGQIVRFMKTTDWITGSEAEAGSCLVKPDGGFRLEIEIDQTTELFTYLGVFRAFFYASPGHSYTLVLPERQDKSSDDQLNPYFEPVSVHLGIEGLPGDELNLLIMMFDDAYDPYYDKHAANIYGRADFQALDADMEQIEQRFRTYPDPFFQAYRRYHYGMARFSASQQRVQYLSDTYFNNQPVLYGHPAYAMLFNRVYDKYFVFFGRTEQGKKIFDDINILESYAALSHSLKSGGNFTNDTLAELVILKQVADEFYRSDFSRKGLLSILDTIIARSTIDRHRQIGAIIRKKVTRLLPGFEPPDFRLQDTRGNYYSLHDFKGQYVYLNFCTCQSYACLNEFNQLGQLKQRHGSRITILTIATDPPDSVFTRFTEKNGYNWLFLHYHAQPQVMSDYDIRAFPVYYLIGPDGKLILSPAPSPAENFETRLFEILRNRGAL